MTTVESRLIVKIASESERGPASLQIDIVIFWFHKTTKLLIYEYLNSWQNLFSFAFNFESYTKSYAWIYNI